MSTTIERGFVHPLLVEDRYHYDFGRCSLCNGWAQVDTGQDASYFGTWANPTERKIFAYVEGDTIETTCDTDEEYAAELRELKAWNESHGWQFLGIYPGSDAELRAHFDRLELSDLLH